MGTSKLWEPSSAGVFSVLSQERIPTLWLPLQVENGPALATAGHAPWEGGLEAAQPAIILLLSGPGLAGAFPTRIGPVEAGRRGPERMEKEGTAICFLLRDSAPSRVTFS